MIKVANNRPDLAKIIEEVTLNKDFQLEIKYHLGLDKGIFHLRLLKVEKKVSACLQSFKKQTSVGANSHLK